MTPATAKIGMNAEAEKQFVDRMLLKWWVAPKKSPAWSGFFSPMIPA